MSRARRRWCVTFACFAVLGACWSFASPPTAAPDELDHVVNAVAVARGQFVGDAPDARQRSELDRGRWRPSAYRSVDVPAIYDDPDVDCYAFHPEQSAACLHFSGSDADAGVLTAVSRYPPAYYALVGVIARPFPDGPFTVQLMRLVGVAVAAALLASGVESLRRRAAPRLRMLGLLAGLTPMALFLSAAVNPSGVEIAAGLALWMSGIVLVREAADQVLDARVVTRAGLAAAVLVLSRQDGPVWTMAIVAVLALAAAPATRAVVRGTRRVRRWAMAVGAVAVLQVGWVVVLATTAERNVIFPLERLAAAPAFRQSFGRSFHWYHEMIGWFGWLDTPAPMFTIVTWTLVLGGLLTLALTFGNRRWVVAVGAVVVVTVVLPVVVEYLSLTDVVAGRWQGRYALPFAAGIPLLAVAALEPGGVDLRIARGRVPIVGAVALGVAQVVAIAQNVRRYAVGADGTLAFFDGAGWSPWPSAVGVIGGFTIALVVTWVWLLRMAPEERLARTPPPVETAQA